MCPRLRVSAFWPVMTLRRALKNILTAEVFEDLFA